MTKTFRYVGFSEFNGETRVRYANSSSRARHLERVGHTLVMFVDMHASETQEECVDALLNLVERGSIALTQAETSALNTEAERLGFIINS